MADDITPKLPDEVAGPEKALVGDEAVQKETFKVEPEVNSDETKQKYAREATQQEVYPVHETSIATDRVITDPTSPLAVQIPDAGRSPLGLPAHQLAQPSPEQAFADGGGEGVDLTDEDRKRAYETGTSLNSVSADKGSSSKASKPAASKS